MHKFIIALVLIWCVGVLVSWCFDVVCSCGKLIDVLMGGMLIG